MNFENRVAVVTGAAGGIGSAVAALLAKHGARVVAWDVAAADSAGTVLRHERISYRRVDVSDEDAVIAAVSETEFEFGPIDILVNVAGVLEKSDAALTKLESWQRMLTVNATGVFLVSRAVAAPMISRKRGAIVTVSSNAAAVPRAGLAAYGASKAAASMFTLSLGLELAQHGIRCNVVAPGSTRTSMLNTTIGSTGTIDDVIKGSLDTHRLGIPLGRVAEPEDVANVVCFLLSDQARHITLETVYVDGGATLHGR